MKKRDLLRFGALALAIGVAPFTMWGALIGGTTAGKTATGTGPDDVDTSTTVNVTYQSYCPWIVAGAAAFPAFNFVFAGQGVASNIPNIDPGDFSISQYNPWVVNSNATTNNMNQPDGGTYNRGVTNQDAGGANIIISYTPLNAGDPTKVNFVQAYVESDNGGAFAAGVIDASPASPYYNNRGISGTGTTLRTGTIPLMTNSTTAAWMLDVPYDCENGQSGVSNADCTGGKDDSLTSQTLYFQSFIEQDKVINGTNYQVLYGGVQWGYSLTMVDTPEPSSLLLAGAAMVAIGLLYRRRQVRDHV
jgi:hypothetical protein